MSNPLEEGQEQLARYVTEFGPSIGARRRTERRDGKPHEQEAGSLRATIEDADKEKRVGEITAGTLEALQRVTLLAKEWLDGYLQRKAEIAEREKSRNGRPVDRDQRSADKFYLMTGRRAAEPEERFDYEDKH